MGIGRERVKKISELKIDNQVIFTRNGLETFVGQDPFLNHVVVFLLGLIL